jgi:hypothetical protein
VQRAKPFAEGLGACPELVEGCPQSILLPQDWGSPRGLKKTPNRLANIDAE